MRKRQRIRRSKMAKIISGKEVSERIKEELILEVQSLKEQGIFPGLAVIIVGDDPASRVYVNNKKKACERIGIYSEEYALSADVTEEEILDLIDELNNKDTISGILVQLPLPKHISEKNVIERINPKKDVDAFHPVNVGKIMTGCYDFVPCTPAGIIELIDESGVLVEGKECVVIGRSNIVGKPMAMLLLHRNGTVTVCHSRTKNLKEKTKNADILVVAVGKPNFVTGDMIKNGAVVIDVGINRPENKKLVGDVDFESAEKVAGAITPVPGGVGPMTIAMLMKNTVKAAIINKENEKGEF
jgi:methylenetetrahydrofolate dehydrogenase (NADP+)/methenyltetrahydrofolate cyclohydrolase